ncbi:Selenocysteine lyase/Cysteine desulfurase [Robiginitalea myxolifaciens]|uniref:Selenocysteine lyase/Cysteine desulfurase n=1 Tax=Robiginitalea myxolifaciens TaxID=400055 RepID=A0A1I6GBP2_9FLAO|nr:aminotransferase class V-fold PLP-dependent enzyme [Robiginitalea myxolifaciens]SFR39624.1 Selenocysteine lyase/Cysteine desulfurase [Robiginitalea myxolifaciens]
MALDLSFIRSQFPAFRDPDLKGWAFFENAGGSYPCQQVVDRLHHFYTHHKVQPYYPYPASIKAGEQMDEAYASMASYLGADPLEIHFGPSTTQNAYVLSHALRSMWNEGDEIIVSCQDHEANAGAWRRLEATGIKIVEWHVDKQTGVLPIEDLSKLFSKRTRMVAFPHCSNVIGHVNPVGKIASLAHYHDALCVVDGVGWAPHEIPDFKSLGADIYLFSSYKTFGPHLGVMYVRHELNLQMANQSHFFKDGSPRHRLTPAGPDHAQVAAAAGMAHYWDAVYEHHRDTAKPGQAEANQKRELLNDLFRGHEMELLAPLLEFLGSRKDLRIIGPSSLENRAPIVSFLPLKKDLKTVYDGLTKNQIMAGYGHFYAVRPLIDMDIPRDPGVIRLSFVHYTSPAEIQQLIAGLESALG